MKKKLIAWMMSATMALGSMTLPVYAENAEVAVEFSNETDEEMEEPETEMLDVPEELQTGTQLYSLQLQRNQEYSKT